MTAAGFPILCSDAVGSSTKFLKNGANGFVFKAGDTEDLKNQLIKIMKMESSELINMGTEGHLLAQEINLQTWSNTLLNFM